MAISDLLSGAGGSFGDWGGSILVGTMSDGLHVSTGLLPVKCVRGSLTGMEKEIADGAMLEAAGTAERRRTRFPIRGSGRR